MTRTLLTHITHLACFDDARRELTDAALLLDGSTTAAVGTRPTSSRSPQTG